MTMPIDSYIEATEAIVFMKKAVRRGVIPWKELKKQRPLIKEYFREDRKIRYCPFCAKR